MKTAKNYKFWFATGSQDLYGDECLQKVAEHSKIIVNELNKSGILPYEVVWKPTLITNEVIRKTFNEANADEECAGVITWMTSGPPQDVAAFNRFLNARLDEQVPVVFFSGS